MTSFSTAILCLKRNKEMCYLCYRTKILILVLARPIPVTRTDTRSLLTLK